MLSAGLAGCKQLGWVTRPHVVAGVMKTMGGMGVRGAGVMSRNCEGREYIRRVALWPNTDELIMQFLTNYIYIYDNG